MFDKFSVRLRDGWVGSDLPCTRKARLAIHTMAASPTMTFFLFQMAMLVGESHEYFRWEEAEEWKRRETYMRSMINSDEEENVAYAEI
jgi:hypothetical protein